jgi:Soluble lytic murein transglycosylase and related regulatory proteins (some contain LysM/invasin domains)
LADNNFEDLWNSTPAAASAAPVQAGPQSFEDLWNSTPALGAVPNVESGVNNVSAQVGKGLSLGFFDELQGLDKAAQNSFLGIFGLGNNKSFGENYQQKVNQARAVDAAYEKAHPYISFGANVAGAALPAIATGGASLLADAPLEAAPIAAPILRNVFGVGFKEAPSIFQMSKLGATAGGIAGAGNATEGNRLAGAATGATVGAVAAPVLGTVINKGVNAVSDAVSNLNLGGRFADQVGAVGADIPSSRGAAYTPEELILAKNLKNTPLEKITNASSEMSDALDSGTPLFLPEALQSAKVNRNARFVANYEPSMEFSQAAINERAAGAGDRLTNLFDTISDERNVFNGASGMSQAAQDILDNATKAKIAAAKPLYDAAKEAGPVVESPVVADLLAKDKYLQSAVANVKKSAQNADLPNNSLDVLIQSKGQLRDAIQAARQNGEANKARLIQGTLDTLHNAMETENPLYKKANATYSALSKGTSALEESKLTFLGALQPDKINDIGQIFNLPPEQLSKLRDSFVKAGYQNEFDGGIRAYLQNIVEKSKDGTNLIKNMISTPRQRSLLKAALGPSYEDIINPLLTEQKIAAGKAAYNTGSSTYGNFAEANDFEKGVGIVSKAFNGNKIQALKDLFTNKMPDDVAQGLAEIYFNPQRGSEALTKIMPLLENYARNKSVSEALGLGAGVVGSRVAPKQPYKEPTKPSVFGLQKKNEPVTQPAIKGGGAVKEDISLDNPDHLGALVQSVIHQESNNNPNAVGPVTRYGTAKGLMQLIDSTGQELFKKSGLPGKYDPFNAEQNKFLGTMYLKQLTDKYGGDVNLALAAYNWGPGNLDRLLKRTGATSFDEIKNLLPRQTQDYRDQILGRIKPTGQILA